MGKKTKAKKRKSAAKPLVSPKRAKEIQTTFDALQISTYTPYQGAEQTGNSFKRFSLYDTDGYTFFTSNKIVG